MGSFEVAGTCLFLTAAAWSQTGVTISATEHERGAGLAPKLTYAIHNNSSVRLTAFIVVSKGKRGGPVMAYSIEDSAMTGHGIPPDGEESVVDRGEVVTALFADGSTAGDAEWAKFFTLSRRYEFEVLGDAIADLEAGIRLQDPDLAKTMDALRKKREGLARGITPSETVDLFEEKTPAQKTANIQALANSSRVDAIHRIYGDSGGSVPLRVKLKRNRDNLIAAQPDLEPPPQAAP